MAGRGIVSLGMFLKSRRLSSHPRLDALDLRSLQVPDSPQTDQAQGLDVLSVLRPHFLMLEGAGSRIASGESALAPFR